jgi:hypothetical protein
VKKAQIIGEIQRTAAANGGVPLGYSKFETETGIRYADWFGVHWARWGDALQEAGFEPNRMTDAYSHEHLLQKYAELTLELGRMPVKGDLKLKRRRDPDYPSSNTFTRLGSKAQLIQQVAEFCRSTSVFNTVVGLCEAYVQSCEGSDEDADPRPETVGYLFKSGRFYKIGHSNSAGRREYELAIQLPERGVTVHVIQTDDPTGIEEYWHRRFAAKRMNGEWFNLNAADVAAFKRRKFM